MLRKIVVASLYTGINLTAIAAWGDAPTEIAALREGSMKKLVVHTQPRDVSETPFTTMEGAARNLIETENAVTVVNFWATWCAPCRKEMPALDALNAEFQDAGVEVIPIATGHNPVPAIERFWETAGISSMQSALDPKSKLARDMAVLGLPVTILIDANGKEIARLTGDADWHSDSARNIIGALLEASAE